MKLRVYRSHLRKALHWYTEQLTERHMAFLTPARVERMRRDLVVLQQQQQKRETNAVWWVPVGLQAYPENNTFEVVVTDDSNLLYLDYDGE